MNTSFPSDCVGLRIPDIKPHHRCYNWSEECEAEWPCEVREYLVSLSPLIVVTKGLLSYGTLVFIVLGLLLNILSFYVLISSGLAKNGSGLYLTSLAICDCGNLLANYAVGIARGHIEGFNRWFMELEWLCRSHGVFVEVFQLISAWVVVSFTVERCIAVWYPLLLRSTSRTRRPRRVLICVSTFLFLFSLPKLFLKGFESDSVFGYAPCHSKRYRWQGMAYVQIAFQTWLPTIMVFVFNCLMFYKLRVLKKARKRLTELKRPKEYSNENEGHQGPTRQTSFITRPSRTAPMLVAVSLAYLVLVFPLGAVQTAELIWNFNTKTPPQSEDPELLKQYIQWMKVKLLLKFIRAFSFGFYQMNFAINFFLYFASGLQFRLHLLYKVKHLFRRADSKDAFSRQNEKWSSTIEMSQRTNSIII